MNQPARTEAAKASRSAPHSARNAADQRQIDVAQYVADMILELRNLAKSANLPKVLAPLEFAYYEAFTAANRVEVPPEELERLKRLTQVAAALESEQETGAAPV